LFGAALYPFRLARHHGVLLCELSAIIRGRRRRRMAARSRGAAYLRWMAGVLVYGVPARSWLLPSSSRAAILALASAAPPGEKQTSFGIWSCYLFCCIALHYSTPCTYYLAVCLELAASVSAEKLHQLKISSFSRNRTDMKEILSVENDLTWLPRLC